LFLMLPNVLASTHPWKKGYCLAHLRKTHAHTFGQRI
jgi:hypothetical protein